MHRVSTDTGLILLLGIKRYWVGTSWRVMAFFIALLLLAAGIGLTAIPTAFAAQTVPYKMNFQGRLTDSSGNVVANGLYNLQLKLYDASTGGTLLWSETRETTNRVQVTNGLFSVQLGDVTALSPTLFNNATARYFEITMATPATATCSTASCATWESPMSPRSPLGSAAYSMNSDLLDGQDGSYYQDASNLNAGTVSGARLSGSYTGITGTGALTVGSIGSGFGTINTGNTISGTQLSSTIATGTAPLTVTSTTKVTNLNVDQLDGLDSTAFAASSGSANYIQNTTSPQTADFNIMGNGIIGGTLGVTGAVTLSSDLTANGYINGGASNAIRLQGDSANDTTYGYVGYYSGTTRQGIILYDGAWSGCRNVTTEFCIKAENSNDMTLSASTNNIYLVANQMLATDNGSEADPTYSFSSNTGAGMYITTDPALGFGYGSGTRMCMNTSQVFIMGAIGNCGNIGAFGTNLQVDGDAEATAAFNRKTNDGAVINIAQGGANQGSISVSGATVSYNAFTGSHYAKIDAGSLSRGELASLTGSNANAPNKAEPIYGIKKSAVANDPNILGSYMDILDTSLPFSIEENPHLVMAAGNGDVWIADNGTGNVKIGDPLISSGDVAGYAQRDPKTFAVSHVFGKAAENIDWSTVTTTVNGVKVKKISALYSFYDAENRSGDLHIQDPDVINQALFGGSVRMGANLNVAGATTLGSLTVTKSVSIQENLEVLGTLRTGTITVNGHLISSGDAPVVEKGTALGGSGASEVRIDGTDTAGTVTFATQSSDRAAGIVARVVFAAGYEGNFKAVLSATNEAATDLRVYVAKTANGFEIKTRDVLHAGVEYEFDYIVVGTKARE